MAYETVKASPELSRRLMEHLGKRGLLRLIKPVSGDVSNQAMWKWGKIGIPLSYVYYLKYQFPAAYREALGKDVPDEAVREADDGAPDEAVEGSAYEASDRQ